MRHLASGRLRAPTKAENDKELLSPHELALHLLVHVGAIQHNGRLFLLEWMHYESGKSLSTLLFGYGTLALCLEWRAADLGCELLSDACLVRKGERREELDLLSGVSDNVSQTCRSHATSDEERSWCNAKS